MRLMTWRKKLIDGLRRFWPDINGYVDQQHPDSFLVVCKDYGAPSLIDRVRHMLQLNGAAPTADRNVFVVTGRGGALYPVEVMGTGNEREACVERRDT